MCLWNNTTCFTMYHICEYLTCSFVYCVVGDGPEMIWHICIIIMFIHLIFICLVLWGSVLQLGLLDASTVCESSFLLSCGSPTTLHIIFSLLWSSMSGNPSSAGPSSDATKNLHLAFLLCVLIFLYTHLTVWYPTDCMTELFLWHTVLLMLILEIEFWIL